MLERMEGLPPGIEGMRAIGKITKDDYDRVFEPMIDEARAQGKRIRFLYELGSDFEGFTAGAAWEDARLGFRALRFLSGCAVVTDIGWIRNAVRMMSSMMPCPMQVFPVAKRDEAIAWLESLPTDVSISYRLIPESGVIVVEPTGPLHVQDFDALAAAADAWIEAHGHLNGLVIHTHEFPGWESFGSMLRHIRFVREHQREIERVALAADPGLGNLVPRIADHFVKAKVKAFGYDELDAAIAWASGSENA